LDLVVVRGREADLRAHINEVTTARDSLENRLAKQDEEAQRVQRLFEHRFTQHDHEMHRMADSYENQLLQAHEGRKDVDAALRARDKQLEAAATAQAELRFLQQSRQDTSVDKAAAHAAELEALRRQLDQRDEAIQQLNERAKSIGARHQANDLVSRPLINCLSCVTNRSSERGGEGLYP
jgi:chromosome segregation ATPase